MSALVGLNGHSKYAFLRYDAWLTNLFDYSFANFVYYSGFC